MKLKKIGLGAHPKFYYVDDPSLKCKVYSNLDVPCNHSFILKTKQNCQGLLIQNILQKIQRTCLLVQRNDWCCNGLQAQSG